jgi:hypothetical protein
MVANPTNECTTLYQLVNPKNTTHFSPPQIVFSYVPANFDIERLLLTTHRKLFDDGLSEYHFDLVTEHFTATLNEMRVEPQLIQEALEVMTPVRNVFVKGAEQARQRQHLFKRNHHVVVCIALSALAIGVFHLLKPRKK